MPLSLTRWRVYGRGLCCVAAACLLAGCVNREPEERAAFIRFLRDHVVDMQGVIAPPLTPEVREAIGGYDKHYDVLAVFQSHVRDALRTADEATQTLSVHTVEELLQRRAQWLTLRAELHRQASDLPRSLAQARQARADLMQADELKVVYGQAFEAAVERPARELEPLWPLLESTLASALEAADFVALRQGEIATKGALTQVRDPSVRDQLNARLAEFNQHAGELGQARQRYCALDPRACAR
ncbi:DUF3053 family protein [Pseudomonadota bacterium AL_CKDN230030165-1A_HGKHYDSX7]